MTRRLLPIGLVALALAAAPLLPGALARADADDTRVTGQAQATFARLVPFLGVPGVNTSLGGTTAQVGSGTAQASAGAADFGLVGTIVNANAGDGSAKQPALQLPEPVNADSEGTQHVDKDPFAAPGAPAPAVGAPSIGGAHETADATRTPLAATGTATGPDLSVPGVLEVTGGLSRSTADAASSTAKVTISQVSLASGQVLLSNLSWDAGQHLGAAAVPAFTLGGLTVAGKPLPVAGPDQLAAAVAEANKALDPFGLALLAPTSDAGDGAAVGPLVVQFRNPQSMVDPTAKVGDAVAPPVLALTKAMIAAYPDASAAQIVVNAALGAAGGRSGGRLELGGVSARSVLGPLQDAGVSGPGVAPAIPPSVPLESVTPPAVGPAGGTDLGVVKDSVKLGAVDMPGMALGDTASHPVSYAVAHHSRRTLTATLLGIGLLLVLLMAAGDRVRALR
jgi:hypothetical protein